MVCNELGARQRVIGGPREPRPLGYKKTQRTVCLAVVAAFSAIRGKINAINNNNGAMDDASGQYEQSWPIKADLGNPLLPKSVVLTIFKPVVVHNSTQFESKDALSLAIERPILGAVTSSNIANRASRAKSLWKLMSRTQI
jgi:hypothetical protein